jgi:hypothetical protein
LTVSASRLSPVAIDARALLRKNDVFGCHGPRFLSLLEHGQHVVLAEDEVLGAVDLDVVACVLRNRILSRP